MNDLNSRDQIDSVFGEDRVIVFKHNTDCPISANAHREMESFLSGGAQVPVYRVDIHEARDVSDQIEERTGIKHESPQVIVLRGGRPEWHADRWDVTADAIRENLGLAQRE